MAGDIIIAKNNCSYQWNNKDVILDSYFPNIHGIISMLHIQNHYKIQGNQ